jgi:hypothetical protein
VTADKSAPEQSAVITLQSPLSQAQMDEACGRLQILLAQGCESITCDVGGPPDLRTVDVLARLVLMTQRTRSRLVVRATDEAAEHLQALIALTGLKCLDQLAD